MAVRIRLRRMGAKKQPFYRVVVSDSRAPRDGRFLDSIGTYNPRSQPAEIRIDRDKALQWLENGAEPTDSARSLLSKAGIWQRFTTGSWPEGRDTVTAAAPTPEETRETAPAVDTAAADAMGSVRAATAGGDSEDSVVPPPDAFAADSPAGPSDDSRIAPQPDSEPVADGSAARE